MVELTENSLEILRISPKIEELLPNQQLKCPESNCKSVFSNTGNLQMHLERHHHRKITANRAKDNKIRLYYCPVPGCCYFDCGKNSDKYFQCLKYVRQHYQKVHAQKSYQCDQCGKTFSTDRLRERHETDCGRSYKCDQCGWEYGSREALLTHAKRKGHSIDLQKTRNNPVKQLVIGTQTTASPTYQIVVKFAETQDQCVQTDAIKTKKTTKRKRSQTSQKGKKNAKSAKIARTQPNVVSSPVAIEPVQSLEAILSPKATSSSSSSPLRHESNLNRLSYVEDVEDPLNICFEQLANSTSLCDIETQTEEFTSAILDQMLYSNMHTQTCDEFLSELGLSDIQTQTNWPAVMDDVEEPPSSGSGVAIIRNGYDVVSGSHDDMLVSTETQTSFTQCLLEYNESSAGTNSNGITQHTQTCDTLLEGLFGGQESDLIANFQSTHTQT